MSAVRTIFTKTFSDLRTWIIKWRSNDGEWIAVETHEGTEGTGTTVQINPGQNPGHNEEVTFRKDDEEVKT